MRAAAASGSLQNGALLRVLPVNAHGRSGADVAALKRMPSYK
jgi:hypothetical protein